MRSFRTALSQTPVALAIFLIFAHKLVYGKTQVKAPNRSPVVLVAEPVASAPPSSDMEFKNEAYVAYLIVKTACRVVWIGCHRGLRTAWDVIVICADLAQDLHGYESHVKQVAGLIFFASLLGLVVILMFLGAAASNSYNFFYRFYRVSRQLVRAILGIFIIVPLYIIAWCQYPLTKQPLFGIPHVDPDTSHHPPSVRQSARRSGRPGAGQSTVPTSYNLRRAGSGRSGSDLSASTAVPATRSTATPTAAARPSMSRADIELRHLRDTLRQRTSDPVKPEDGTVLPPLTSAAPISPPARPRGRRRSLASGPSPTQRVSPVSDNE